MKKKKSETEFSIYENVALCVEYEPETVQTKIDKRKWEKKINREKFSETNVSCGYFMQTKRNASNGNQWPRHKHTYVRWVHIHTEVVQAQTNGRRRRARIAKYEWQRSLHLKHNESTATALTTTSASTVQCPCRRFDVSICVWRFHVCLLARQAYSRAVVPHNSKALCAGLWEKRLNPQINDFDQCDAKRRNRLLFEKKEKTKPKENFVWTPFKGTNFELALREFKFNLSRRNEII